MFFRIYVYLERPSYGQSSRMRLNFILKQNYFFDTQVNFWSNLAFKVNNISSIYNFWDIKSEVKQLFLDKV